MSSYYKPSESVIVIQITKRKCVYNTDEHNVVKRGCLK